MLSLPESDARSVVNVFASLVCMRVKANAVISLCCCCRSNLVFYAQSTITVISGRSAVGKRPVTMMLLMLMLMAILIISSNSSDMKPDGVPCSPTYMDVDCGRCHDLQVR